jgi:hypothetical protein
VGEVSRYDILAQGPLQCHQRARRCAARCMVPGDHYNVSTLRLTHTDTEESREGDHCGGKGELGLEFLV